MEIRLIEASEYIHYTAICHIVFFEASRSDMRSMIASQNNENKNADPALAAFDSSGKIMSAMTIHPYKILMHGKEVQMAGIGGVVTSPDARSKGLVRQIFIKAFQMMRENNQIYSFLYPFSYGYYRKFGYEYCYFNNHAKIPTMQLMSYPYPSHVKPHEPGDSFAPYAKIYELFTKNRNLAFVRGQKEWENILNRDPYVNLRFTFLFGHPESPTAYVLYDGQRNAENSLHVKEICFSSPEGLYDVLGFMGRLSPESKYIHWNVPTGVDIHSLSDELYDVSVQRRASGMGRVVDVLAALNNIKAPNRTSSCRGHVQINVRDDFLPENTGLYYVEWEGEHLFAQRVKSHINKSADLEITVEALMQLLSGLITPNEAVLRRDTKIYSKEELLLDLFPHNQLYVMEQF